MSPVEIVIMAIGVFLATCFALYLWLGENILYHIAESFYIGGIVALGIFSLYKSLAASVFDPMAKGKIILIIPVIIGLFAFARLTKARWLARYPVAIMSGIGIGVIFGLTIRSQIINVVVMTVDEVIKASPDRLSAIYMFIGIICVLTYFLYSARISKHFHTPTGKLRYLVTLGRYFLMASFGYLAGYIAVISFGNVADFLVIVWKRFVDALMGLA
ncbi:MAG: hypothetical protein QXF26_08760 [Candidatus Bathyarchaeia archaeon]